MLLTALLAIVTMLLKFAPDVPLARLVNRMCVLWPLEQARKATLQDVIFGVILLGFLLGGAEAFFLLGPELVTAFAFDLSIYLDAVLVTYALASWKTVKDAVAHLRSTAARVLRRPRASRRKRVSTRRREKPSANDDEPHSAVRLAA